MVLCKAGFVLLSSDLIHILFSTLSNTNMIVAIIIHTHASTEYSAHREGIKKESTCGKCIEMETQLKEALTFRHRASCILGRAFRYSPKNAFYIFNQQIYFII